MDSVLLVSKLKRACAANSHDQVRQLLEETQGNRRLYHHFIESVCDACFRIFVEVRGPELVYDKSISDRNITSIRYSIIFEQYLSDYAAKKEKLPHPLALVSAMLDHKRFDLLKFLIADVPAAILKPNDSRDCEAAVIEYACSQTKEKKDAEMAFKFIWQPKNFRFLQDRHFVMSFKTAVRKANLRPLAIEILEYIPDWFLSKRFAFVSYRDELIEKFVTKWSHAITQRLPSGRIPFHIALQICNVQMIRKLLEMWPNAYRLKNESNGWTSLHYAALNRTSDVVRMLLEEYVVNPLEEDIHGKNPLFTLFDFMRYRDIDSEKDKIFRLLAPRLLQQDAVLRYKFHQLFRLVHYAVDISSKWPFLYEHCMVTIYGPEVNSKFHLIERLMEEFPSHPFTKRRLTIFLHDLLNPNDLGDWKVNEHIIRACIETLFDLRSFIYQSESDELLELFFILLAELRCHYNRAYVDWNSWGEHYFPLCFIPPHTLKTREVAKRMAKALEKIARDYRLELTFVGEELFNPSYGLIELNTLLIETGCFAVVMNFSKLPQLQDDGWMKTRKDFELVKSFLPEKIVKKHDPNKVTDLKHLARLQIRQTLVEATDDDIWKFLDAIDELPLPRKVKNYLRYLNDDFLMNDDI